MDILGRREGQGEARSWGRNKKFQGLGDPWDEECSECSLVTSSPCFQKASRFSFWVWVGCQEGFWLFEANLENINPFASMFGSDGRWLESSDGCGSEILSSPGIDTDTGSCMSILWPWWKPSEDKATTWAESIKPTALVFPYVNQFVVNSNTLATWCEELTHLKRSWCWERLKAGGEGDDRRWDGWMASPTQWTWVWASSRSWWWTGRPGVLQSMGSQRAGHDWATELNQLIQHIMYACCLLSTLLHA